MRKNILLCVVVILLLASSFNSINAFEIEIPQSKDIVSNSIFDDDPFNGYILYTPWYSLKTYLIDNNGKIIKKGM